MRENYLAFVVRPAGGTWELLVMNTYCGASRGEFDVPRGRVPHGREIDAVVRADQARYGIELGKRIAMLGEEPLLETRRRQVFVYRAAEGLPVSWTKRTEPDPRRPLPKGMTMPDVVGHFRFVNLAQPVAIGQDEAGWLDEVRKAVGMPAAEPITLVSWMAADAKADADAQAVAAALLRGEAHPAALPHDFAALAKRVRSHSGWTQDARRLALSPVKSHGRQIALVARVVRDGTTSEQARFATIATAGYEGCWTFDLTREQLFRANEHPVSRAAASTATTDRELLELKFDAALVAELAHLGGPLMVWPLAPPVDAAGNLDEFRAMDDEAAELPHAMWVTPANEALILGLDNIVSGYFFSNHGLICPAADDVAPLRAHEERRVITLAGGATKIHAYEHTQGWDALVEHLGWAYLPNGPDTLWGDLHVAERNRPLLDAIREFCRRTGRTWAHYESRGGEIVRIIEKQPARQS